MRKYKKTIWQTQGNLAGMSMLAIAVIENELGAARKLLQQGQDPNEVLRGVFRPQTALGIAVLNNSIEMARLLVEAGGDINQAYVSLSDVEDLNPETQALIREIRSSKRLQAQSQEPVNAATLFSPMSIKNKELEEQIFKRDMLQQKILETMQCKLKALIQVRDSTQLLHDIRELSKHIRHTIPAGSSLAKICFSNSQKPLKRVEQTVELAVNEINALLGVDLEAGMEAGASAFR